MKQLYQYYVIIVLINDLFYILKYDNKKVYFPIVNKHLSIPIDLMEEILKEMESIKYEEFNE